MILGAAFLLNPITPLGLKGSATLAGVGQSKRSSASSHQVAEVE